MPNFKPQATFTTQEGIRDYRNNQRRTSQDVNVYPTYVRLKKNIKQMLEDSIDNRVSVSRSRRGEWGEYFEIWELIDGKPTITKQGWQ